MRKLSEIRGENALDVLADLIDPISKITKDKKFVDFIRKGDRLAATKVLLKEHKRSIIEVLAILNEEDPDSYEPSLLSLPAMIIELLNDPDLANLFQSGETVTPSGSPTVNTEATEGK